jgi:hypothetical protein
VKHVAGLLYTFLFLDSLAAVAAHCADRRWSLAVGNVFFVAWAGGNAYLWSRR